MRAAWCRAPGRGLESRRRTPKFAHEPRAIPQASLPFLEPIGFPSEAGSSSESAGVPRGPWGGEAVCRTAAPWAVLAELYPNF